MLSHRVDFVKLNAPAFEVASSNGWRRVSVIIDQETSLGPYRVRLERPVAVTSGTDYAILGAGMRPDWTPRPQLKLQVDPQAAGSAYQGQPSLALEADGRWTLLFSVDEPVRIPGYRALRFAVHPGTGTGTLLNVKVGDTTLDLLADDADGVEVDLGQRSWQEVEVPQAGAGIGEVFEKYRMRGSLRGTLYIADMRLVAERPAAPTSTACAPGGKR